ncbi:vicilin-like seed storage protein At2g18540 [Miscanthus floridulus]|uniref:vicilin-like seed storage protein At2g18540 n=1 Tax=Miscanthus floridulus TaxID=154761 RepID=UPI003457BDC7
MANHTAAEWQRKTKEVERKKKQEKLLAREREEETDNDDDDEDDNREKSQFLREHKEDWDCLIDEEAEARRDVEAAKKSFDELSERAQRDQEEATRGLKERDELLQRDAETRQRNIDLLAEAEKERDLRLGAEERFTALEQRARLDAEVVAQLRKE